MKGLHIITLGLLAVVTVGTMKENGDFRDQFEDMDLRMAEYELEVEAKEPLIKFPGYDCDDSIIKGHCTKWDITQAEYDKNNAHLFKDES